MSRKIAYTVAEDVFARHPAYRVAVVLAVNVRNGESQPDLVALFARACADVESTVDLETISAHDRIRPWREAFRGFGAKPSDFRPSVEALARRAARGSLSPLGRLIDIGTVISLRHLVPVGGHALDGVRGDIGLRPATGRESFHAVGAGTVEHPAPGEIILAEGDTVLTRRWVWRQAERTAIRPDTRTIAYNVDILPEAADLDAGAIAAELALLIADHAGGELSIAVLDAANPRIHLAF